MIAVKRRLSIFLQQWVLSTQTGEPTCVLSVHLKKKGFSESQE